MSKPNLFFFLAPTLALGAVALAARTSSAGEAKPAPDPVARGEYLVRSMGCYDCHTPHVLGPNGPEPDRTRWLAGHPETLELPPAPELPPGPWIVSAAASMTAWSGPWGTSFTANLTPDEETGLGRWTFEQFRDAIRTGRHQGRGRPILPPMPWQAIANMTDDDLAAVFAYLRSIPAISNRVPEPLPPPDVR